MKFTIVTISYNQARFLERTIRSVIDQGYRDLEYIIVDPGSTDGSREIIERYRSHFAKVVFEPDRGAADGLNKGFSLATGEIYGFLNSDDVLLPRALAEAASFLETHPDTHVVSGDCLIIDADDRTLRRSFSDRFSLRRYAYGTGILIQPSTFFRADAFKATSGFNVDNRSNWDGELFVSMLRQGARFARSRRLWSGYRLHEFSITGSAKMHDALLRYHERMFGEIMRRKANAADRLLGIAYLSMKYLENPQALTERLAKGRVYGRTRRS